MPSIRIQNFGGLVPRMSPRLLAGGQALRAELTKLWSGEIRPFIEKAKIDVPLVQDCMAKTIYKFKDVWLSWCADVDVVTGFTLDQGSERLYYTGDGGPKITTYPLAVASLPTPANSLPLGVPEPTLPPILGTPTGTAGTPQLRYYVYTWYSNFDEESVPSPPSAGINVSDGQHVPIQIPMPMVQPVNIETVRVYRTNGGPFLFVKEVPFEDVAAGKVVTDDVKNIDLGEAIISTTFYPPPNNIQGLIGLSSGSFAAFHDNRVVFSEPYQPHAWPPEYEKIFDFPVVALGTYGNTLVVATTGYTYLVAGTDPRSLSVDRVPDPYPCVSKRSMVSADRGVVYASGEGLVFVGLYGTQILTRALMTRDEWQQFNPSTMHGVIFDGRYYGFYESTRYFSADETVVPAGAGFIFDFNDRIVYGLDDDSAISKDDKLATIPYHASATFANPVTQLHLVINPTLKSNELFKWEGGVEFEPYVWRSKQFAFPYEITFAGAKVLRQCKGEQPLKFRLCDGECGKVVFERDVTTNRPFRLPSRHGRTDWIVEIEGTAFVQEIHVSTSFMELSEGQAQ
jgi:hypothetical protein